MQIGSRYAWSNEILRTLDSRSPRTATTKLRNPLKPERTETYKTIGHEPNSSTTAKRNTSPVPPSAKLGGLNLCFVVPIWGGFVRASTWCSLRAASMLVVSALGLAGKVSPARLTPGVKHKPSMIIAWAYLKTISTVCGMQWHASCSESF